VEVTTIVRYPFLRKERKMQNRVFVIGKDLLPLMPCRPARARILLKKGRAVVWRMQPFTIMLLDRTTDTCDSHQPLILKLDPGAETTGIALLITRKGQLEVIWAANLKHRGSGIKKRIDKRRNIRRSRRSRKTRYRKPRFNNRKGRHRGWLPPSLQSRVDNVYHWCQKLIKKVPVSEIEVEVARFDTQKMENPEISGVMYQQGILAGYNVREYLLEKWGRKCAYCSMRGIPLQIEHIHPKSKQGSDRVSNLTLACEPCNQAKGCKDIRVYLAHSPKRLHKILRQAQRPLRSAAIMNATRYAIGDVLKTLGLPISFWTGARTKFNRLKQGYPKDHWIDAACVGESGANVNIRLTKPLYIKATGRGNRQMCQMDKYGFPRTRLDKETGKRVPSRSRSSKRVEGFQTGDHVRAVVPKGKHKGTHVGRVTIRATGSFDIKTKSGKVTVHFQYCQLLQRDDGYSYSHVPPKKKKNS
jgi:5-methylcytosine-specific restriction endonuclease McrA